MNKRIRRIAAVSLGAALTLTTGGASLIAAEDLGKFPGYKLRVKLNGGNQHHPLYARIGQWEAATGAKVEIVSEKIFADLDKEIKQDIASGTLNWCVASNHTSFAPQYVDIYVNLNDHIPRQERDKFVPRTLESATVNGVLTALPRDSDISGLYYQKSLFADPQNQKKFKEKYGYDLAPAQTWAQFKDQAIFFTNPPDRYGTAFVGKDEGLTGRFFEMLTVNGGEFFDKNYKPAFNSQVGVDALQWFVDLYNAKAVPAGTVNYYWDDLGQGFASGSEAINIDWSGWAAFFNDPANSKVANNVGIAQAPKGTTGKRSGWSASHAFSITKTCDNIPAAVSFLLFMTDFESQMLEARTGLLPTRKDAWAAIVKEFQDNKNTYMSEIMASFQKSMTEDSFTPPLIPQWLEVSNALWPELQAAIVGSKTAKAALDIAAAKATDIMIDAGLLKK